MAWVRGLAEIYTCGEREREREREREKEREREREREKERELWQTMAAAKQSWN